MDMQIAIITVAGVSSRFNQGIKEEDKQLKAVYSEADPSQTLLSHMIKKCSFADRIIIVGGYKYEDLCSYISEHIPESVRGKIVTVYNDHFSDLPTGYSLYCGIKEALKYKDEGIKGILFAEGDLDVDDEAFSRIAGSEKTVLTYNRDVIRSNKAVVLYQNADGRYRYAFNSDHGFLKIEEAFSCLYNSGQIWRFHDAEKLQSATERYLKNDVADGTNLKIIEYYAEELDPAEVDIIGFNRWVNCNTREDYRMILKGWLSE